MLLKFNADDKSYGSHSSGTEAVGNKSNGGRSTECRSSLFSAYRLRTSLCRDSIRRSYESGLSTLAVVLFKAGILGVGKRSKYQGILGIVLNGIGHSGQK